MMKSKQKDNSSSALVLKKQWEAPKLYVIDQNAIHSGGVPGGAEGQLTPHAAAPFTSGSIYHS